VSRFCSVFYPLVDRGSVTFLKRLMGRTNVEDALLRLDELTQEECLITAARTLGVTHHVANVVRDVGDGVKATKSLTEAIDENVKVTKALTKDIDANVTKVTKALAGEVGDGVKMVERVTRSVVDNVRDNTRRAYFFFYVRPSYTDLFPATFQNSCGRD